MRTFTTVCCLLSLFLLRAIPPVSAEDVAQIPLDGTESTSKYQAPLENCDANDVTPNQYIIHLAKGVTLKEHQGRVRHALQKSHIRWTYDTEFPDNVWYSVEMSAKWLAVIRADEGVTSVECAVSSPFDSDVARKVEGVLNLMRSGKLPPREEL